MFTYASALVSPVLKVETFADRKFHGSAEPRNLCIWRMTNIQKFHGHKLSLKGSKPAKPRKFLSAKVSTFKITGTPSKMAKLFENW